MSAFDAWAVPANTLPPGLTTLTADGLRWPCLDAEACRGLARTLRAARGIVVADHTARCRAALIGRAGARFLDRDDPLRREAEERLPPTAGLSAGMARAVIDGMARDWTEQRLLAMLAAELHDPAALDRFVNSPGVPGGLRVRSYAPSLSLHLGASTVPGVSATSLVRALLIGSSALVKPGRADVVLPVLFTRALAEVAPELAAMAAVVYWEGGTSAAEQAALDEADAVVVYGGDETIRAVRTRVRAATRLVLYHHRISAAVLGREAFAAGGLEDVAETCARAVAMFDQRGCVSPHAFFVEEGGAVSPQGFAAALAAALDVLESVLPAAKVTPAEGAWLQQLRSTAELRAAAGEAVEVFSAPGTAWTVVLEPAAVPEPCVARSVRVHPVREAWEACTHLAPLGAHLQTVGLAGLQPIHRELLAAGLGEIGAVRICALSEVPFPPPWWHHDGQGPLAPLLRWVDLEGPP